MLKVILRNFTHFYHRKMSLFSRNNCPFVSWHLRDNANDIQIHPRGTGLFWIFVNYLLGCFEGMTSIPVIFTYCICKCPHRYGYFLAILKLGNSCSLFIGIIFHIFLYFNFSSASKVSHPRLRFASREWHTSSIKITSEAEIWVREEGDSDPNESVMWH